MLGSLQAGGPHCCPARAHSLLGRQIHASTHITQSRVSSEPWEHHEASDSFSLRDLGAASERRQHIIWALKDALGGGDKACFVQEE